MAESGSKNGGMDATLPPDPEDLAKPPTEKVSTAEFGPGESGPDGAEPEADLNVLTVGATVGRYIVVERLGAGAMGVVYAAYDPKLDRKVALKLLRPARAGSDHARRTARLEREAQAVAKLSHPNVVGIFDVLVYEDRVVLAMEYLGGGTLRSWMGAQKRPWREIVRMFIEVGKGLAAAHAAGQIHRDFKPDNVLLDGNGVPKVADFGLARVRSTTGVHKAVAPDDERHDASLESSPSLTRTGAITGTPAYMAPEQFVGKEVDGRTDQFAFCVALYEALYGERPFAGENIISIAESVTAGRIRATPKNSDVPAWVRAAVVRGLNVAPAERYHSLDELIVTLSINPVTRRWRRVGLAATAAALISGVWITGHFTLRRRHEIERQAAEQIALADTALSLARAKRADAKALRARAFAAFDAYEREKGEDLWAQTLTTERAADAGYQRGVQGLEAAMTLSPRPDLEARIADALLDYITMDDRTKSEREIALQKLSQLDQGGKRAGQLSAPALLQVQTNPPAIAVEIESYDPLTFRSTQAPRSVGQTPLVLTLPPGSYRLTFAATPTHAGFYYPIVLGPGEHFQTTIPVPTRSSIPRDFEYIPEGRFFFGSAEEDLREAFLNTTPLRSMSSPAFLIAKHETTYADWIAFLDDLPEGQQKANTPTAGGTLQGRVSLRRAGSAWELELRPTVQTYSAAVGEKIQYLQRSSLSSQDWSAFPVSGISALNMLAYLRWLAVRKGIAGARLCTEKEWERAARGADQREFPHASQLNPDEANFDATYGRKSAAFGPDAVGSHPASRSPFGIDDLAGNVMELTTSVLARSELVLRGGSYYYNSNSQRSTNREPVDQSTRTAHIGLRVCVDFKEGSI